jgi:DHA1 family bicyclomycin/chloramphenicol resistance-like MFS transporter
MTTTQHPPAEPGFRRLALVLGAATAFVPLAIDMYLPALPGLERSLGGAPGSAQLTLAAFLLGLAIGQAIYGPLSDRFGRRVPLLCGVVIFALASVGCALAPSMDSLIVLRFVQALGGCAGMVVARAVARDRFDGPGQARMFALLMLIMGAAPILAPFIGGQILLFADWRGIFWVLAAVSVGTFAAVYFALPESMSESARQSLAMRPVARAYATVLTDRHFMAHALASGFAMAAMFGYIAGSPHVFIDLHGVAPQAYGWLFGINAVAIVGAAQLNHRLLRHYGAQRLMNAAMFALLVAALVLLVNGATGFGGLAGIVVPLACYMAALGFLLPNTTVAAMARHGRIAGTASSTIGVLQFAFGSVAGAAVGVMEGGALPMVGTIATFAVLAMAAWLCRPREVPVRAG